MQRVSFGVRASVGGPPLFLTWNFPRRTPVLRLLSHSMIGHWKMLGSNQRPWQLWRPQFPHHSKYPSSAHAKLLSASTLWMVASTFVLLPLRLCVQGAEDTAPDCLLTWQVSRSDLYRWANCLVPAISSLPRPGVPKARESECVSNTHRGPRVPSLRIFQKNTSKSELFWLLFNPKAWKDRGSWPWTYP